MKRFADSPPFSMPVSVPMLVLMSIAVSLLPSCTLFSKSAPETTDRTGTQSPSPVSSTVTGTTPAAAAPRFRSGDDKSRIADLYYQLGLLSSQKGEHARAVHNFRKALTIYLNSADSTHPRVASIYNFIGTGYYRMRKYRRAVDAYRKSVASLRRDAANRGSLKLASRLGSLGLAYWKTGRLDRAVQSFQAALQIEQRRLPADSPLLAKRYTYLGMIYWRTRKYARAADYYRKALAIEEKAGRPVPGLAQKKAELALIYRLQKDYPNAIRYYEQAVELERRLVGDRHKRVAARYADLGNVYRLQGDYTKAVEAYRKALQIERTLYGSGHPRVARRYNTLGALYRKQGKIDAAIGSYRQALSIRLKHLGEKHPKVRSARKRLSLLNKRRHDSKRKR